MITESMEPQPRAKVRAVLIVVTSLAAIMFALLAVNVRVAPQDARPHFGSQSVDTQVYLVGEEIELKLPAATRANGPLIYQLYPQVPGLALARTTLKGTPAEPGAYSMIYTVVDSDGDTTGGDKDWLTFTIIVESPRSGWSLDELGEDIDGVDFDGTALCKAARYAGPREVKVLLDLGADPNISYGDKPRTHPISCALAGGKPLAEIRLIMQALADGGAVLPRGGISFEVPSGLSTEDYRSVLSPFFEGRR